MEQSSFLCSEYFILEKEYKSLGLLDITAENFDSVALSIFRYQADNCSVYHQFIKHMSIDVNAIKETKDIPYLPIDFFKSHTVLNNRESAQVTFKSSGTSGSTTSQHHVADIDLYKKSFLGSFNLFYGNPSDYCILGLLPSYIEQGDSSLVFMVDELVTQSGHAQSGFYLNDYQNLFNTLALLKDAKTPTILFGVTYALLDLAEQFPMDFEDLIIIETGGMKGRRKEMIRAELHDILNVRLGTFHIHSEYGMTELLSQAYAGEDEVFYCPPWMKVTMKDLHDPKADVRIGKTGRIHVVDLANINSCSFIATHDLGQSQKEGGFKVLGRVDHSDMRGCNLLVF